MSPAPAVTLLLGVWGRAYVEGFLSLSLCSLLAPGNLPALAARFPCAFTFLTTPEDEARIRAHAMFPRLSRHCEVRFVDIADLVFPGNHSTTLTLAYERAIRAAGPAMLRTYFIHLVGDYVMADGSLAGLVKYLERGVSGITSGNFQIVEEETRDDLLARRADGVLAMSPRALVAYALGHLHPVTIGSTLGQAAVHNWHANRLFWRVGDQALVGRFYLRHMLCIRPETTDFQIGSSCDYSFIPEMCPSGNVVALADSDEYCVVELQPRAHERRFLASGPVERVALARDLSEWTNAEHRRNVDVATVFRAGPVDVSPVVAASQRFVDGLKPLLSATPQPVRGHHYWKGAVRIAGRGGVLGDLQARAVGWPPAVNRWHHLWQDYGPVIEHLTRARAAGRRVTAVQKTPNPCSFWLTREYPEGTRFVDRDRGEVPSADVCYFFVESSQCRGLDAAIERALSSAPEVVVHIRNDGRDVVGIAGRLGRKLAVRRTHIARSRFRRRADLWRGRLADFLYDRRRPLRVLVALAGLPALQCAYRLDNAMTDWPALRSDHASSCTLFLERPR